MSQHKTYLGDGVYASLERGMIALTTEDGIRVLNRIYLEPEVWRALQEWVERVGPEGGESGS